MNLAPGQIIETGPRDRYEVVADAWTGPGHRFIRARKVLWNYHAPTRSVVPAPADEALDVLVRIPTGPAGDLAFELATVLGRPDAPWFPEPLDVIEPADGPPCLVLSDPHAGPLSDWPTAGPIVAEVRAMLAALHRLGLAIGGVGPRDIVVDQTGRWSFFATDRVATATPDAIRLDLDGLPDSSGR